jgi:predicted enzyme related to lactoylglutathione lyase
MSIDNALASVAVRDLKASVKWYEKVFGRPADSTPMRELAEWRFGGGGRLQVYELPERAGSGSFTLAVSRIDEEIEKLRGLGVDPGKPMTGKGLKVVMIKDPDGNSIAFAEGDA